MRVGIVAPEFPPDIGGIQAYGYEFARELARQGHEVVVFTEAREGARPAIQGAQIVDGLRRRRRLDRPVLARWRVDVWHVMNASYAWLAEEFGNVVISVHGNDFLRPYLPVARPDLGRFPGLWRIASRLEGLDRWLGGYLTARSVRRCLPKARHIMTNSRYTEQALLQQYPRCRGRTTVGYVGVSEDCFAVQRDRTAHPQSTHLVTVCRLSEQRKNVDVVLRSLERLRGVNSFRYTVVGDGEQRRELERLCGELDLSDRVQFTGQLPRRDVLEVLGRADLFVLPSSVSPTSHEGFGIVYLEANACGTPVLAARLGGAAEAVEEGVTGLFVEEPTVAAVTAALRRFMNGEMSFREDACREFARRFTWQRVVAHALEHYPQVAAGLSGNRVAGT